MPRTKKDLIGIPEKPIGPGKSGSTPASRKGLLRRRLRRGKLRKIDMARLALRRS